MISQKDYEEDFEQQIKDAFEKGTKYAMVQLFGKVETEYFRIKDIEKTIEESITEKMYMKGVLVGLSLTLNAIDGLIKEYNK